MSSSQATDNRAIIEKFVGLLSSKKQSVSERIVIFTGAAISSHSPSCLPVAYDLRQRTIDLLLQNERLKDALDDDLFKRLQYYLSAQVASQESGEYVPLERIYDAIYEFAEERTFHALDVLRSDRPNQNHKILATLLDQGYIDAIITPNFDGLLEASLSHDESGRPSPVLDRIWKIHGDFRNLDAMVATFRRVGRSFFDDKLINRLCDWLDDSHVLFVGYAGADPNLLPAFRQAKMKSVTWCVYNESEISQPAKIQIWHTFRENGIPLNWVVGDLHADLLVPIASELQRQTGSPILSEGPPTSLCDRETRLDLLDASLAAWEQDRANHLSIEQKTRALLLLLYRLALSSPDSIDVWTLLLDVAHSMSQYFSVAGHQTAVVRDMDALQAEAYLMLSNNAKEDGELGAYVTLAKDCLTPHMQFRGADAVQVQILLNAGTILSGLAARLPPEKRARNIQGAEQCFRDALKKAQRASLFSDIKNNLMARCNANLAALYMITGRTARGLKHFAKAHRQFDAAGDVYGYIGNALNTARANLAVKRRAQALDNYQTAWCLLRAFPDEQQEELMRNVSKLPGLQPPPLSHSDCRPQRKKK